MLTIEKSWEARSRVIGTVTAHFISNHRLQSSYDNPIGCTTKTCSRCHRNFLQETARAHNNVKLQHCFLASLDIIDEWEARIKQYKETVNAVSAVKKEE